MTMTKTLEANSVDSELKKLNCRLLNSQQKRQDDSHKN